MSISMAFRGASKKVLVALSLFLPLTVATFGVQAQDGAQASPQVSVQQGVTVKVTPKAVGASIVRWQFAVVFDTHSSDLSDDLLKTATLMTADGREIKPVAWTGAAPGGHHREGVLEFVMTAPPPSVVELRLERPGEAESRVFRWKF
jgi:hypothetical protein